MNGLSIARPLISIIIVVYNAKKTIQNAIESVIKQIGNYELIVIDGASKDGTVEIIKMYNKHLSFWTSEPDKGIYDAMNKGIEFANGEWIYFLGSDDVLLPGIISRITPFLLTRNEVLIYGDVEYEGGGFFKSHFSLLTLVQNTIHHQAAFYNRILFSDFSYDTTISIISDYELNLIIYLKKLRSKRINMMVATCSKEGRSRNPNLSFKETNAIRKKHVQGLSELASYFILKTKYMIMSLYRAVKAR